MSLPGSARCERRLDAVGGGVSLADRGAGRDADHDVGERPAGRLAQPEAPERDGRLEARDRVARGRRPRRRARGP